METTGYLQLKRFAIHDGPGIRTTLFLKGCPLSCQWCHNPEGISARPELAIHFSRCTACGDCAQVCHCHQIVGGKHQFQRDECSACGKCEAVCLHGALELFGKRISSAKAAELLLEDRRFYGHGGGVTLSGGEPLLQSKFCAEVFQLLKAEGIHCAIDTCGEVSWDAFEQVLPLTDLFLYDIKLADSVKHKAYTGHGNERILDNLARLDATGKPIEIRMLLIPGYNLEAADVEKAAAFLVTCKHLTAIRLLPYHSLARSKYRAIGRPDNMPEVPSPDFADLEKAAQILRSYGLRVINALAS